MFVQDSIHLVSRSHVARLLNIMLLFFLMLSLPLSAAALTTSPAAAGAVETTSPVNKFDPELSVQFSRSKTADFFVWLKPQASLSAALTITDKPDRGAYVLTALQTEAARSQVGVIQQLNTAKASYQSYYITNVVLVRGGSPDLARSLAERADVARLSLNRKIEVNDLPLPASQAPSSQAASGVATNLTFIKADQAWSQGINGSGVTVAVIDSGLMWDHPAIKTHYRGWNGASANHNYNWWDAAGDAAGNRLLIPYDLHGHGTHVSGTVIGDDGSGTVTGVAPGAKLIACRAGDEAFTTSALLSCLEWVIAPWDLNNAHPDPSKAPDILNNSWGSNILSENDLELAFDAIRAAGIVVVDAAGNEGPDCQTMNAESNIPGVISVGALDYEGLPFPGRVSSFSARGPSPRGAAYAPMVMAPGTNIVSAYIDGQYISWYGTSMAAPHVAGLAALILQANPALKGHPDDVAYLIRAGAQPLSSDTSATCGGPNNHWGRGAVDALAAVTAAMSYSTHRGTLSGSVAFSGLPAGAELPLATVQLSWGDLIYTTLSDTSGHYQLSAQAGHTYQVAIYAAGYQKGTGSFTPVDGGQSTRSDTLTPISTQHALSGSITDRLPGWPMVTIVLVTANNPAYNTLRYSVSSPADGAYTINLVNGVEYYVQPLLFAANSGTYLPGQPALAPAASTNQSLNLQIEPDALFCQLQEYERQGSGYDFYYSNYLPSGWENVDLTSAGNGPLWNLNPPVNTSEDPNIAGGLGVYALADSTAYPNQDMDAALVTAPKDITSLMYVAVQFNYTLHGGHASVEYSTDQGNTWQLLDTLYPGTEVSWYERLKTRTAGQNSIRFRIRYQGHNSGYLALDDFGLTTCRARSGGFMYGVVKDANTGQPVAGARINAYSSFTTVAESYFYEPLLGMYRLFVPLTNPGSISARVNNAPYYDSILTTNYLAPDASTQVDFSLKASQFQVQPGSALQVNVQPGEAKQVALAITNTGKIAGVARAFLSTGGVASLAHGEEWTSENNYDSTEKTSGQNWPKYALPKRKGS